MNLLCPGRVLCPNISQEKLHLNLPYRKSALQFSMPSMNLKVPRVSPSGLFAQLLLLLGLVAHTSTMNPGQLGLQLNIGLAQMGMYVYNEIAHFEEDILATW